jgi:hypothetical protein
VKTSNLTKFHKICVKHSKLNGERKYKNRNTQWTRICVILFVVKIGRVGWGEERSRIFNIIENFSMNGSELSPDVFIYFGFN